MPQLFLDCDGVLADFNIYALGIFGEPSRQAEETLGTAQFWETLSNHAGFYANLPLLPDARELFDAVKHLDPIILTGMPDGDWAEPQKRTWAAQHFPGTRVICCKSKDKRLHMQPGDVLVDDWLQYRDLWEQAGGIFVTHTSARATIAALEKLGLLSKETAV